jgi:hypothetical protein
MPNKVGRPTKYKPIYCKRLLEYFDKPAFIITEKTIKTKSGAIITEEIQKPAEPPFLTDFAKTIGVSRKVLWQWGKQYPEFGNALTRAKELQEDIIAKNGLLKLYDGGFAFKSLVNLANWRGETRTIEGTLTLEDKLSHLLADDQPKQIEGEVVDTEAE